MKPIQVISSEDLMYEAQRSNLKLRIVDDNTHEIEVDGKLYAPYWREVQAVMSNYVHPVSVHADVCNQIVQMFGLDNQVLIRCIRSKGIHQDTKTCITFEVSTLTEVQSCA